MACNCGRGCGPIIVRPDIDLNDATIDTGPDREFVVLCDADSHAFLRRFSVDQDGTVSVVDTELDGVTAFTPAEPVGVCHDRQGGESPGAVDPCVHCATVKLWDDSHAFLRTVCHDCDGEVIAVGDAELDGTTPYTPQGEVTACCPDDESPGDPESGQQVVVLCDDTTTFLRTYTLVGGEITGYTDTTLDGDPYTVEGVVRVCGPEEESPAEPECRNSSTFLLCDTDTQTGPEELTATDTDIELAQWSGWVPLPGGGQALWDGGTLVFPSEPNGNAGNGNETNRWVAAQLTAPLCEGSTEGMTAISVHMDAQVDGPANACGAFGSSRIMNVDGTVYTTTGQGLGRSNDPATPVGTTIPIDLSAQVPTAELAAGNVYVWLNLRTYRQSLDGWSNCFAQAEGPIGWTVSNFSWTADQSSTDCSTQFVRQITTDCDGQVLSVQDMTLDGQSYTVTGEVGECKTAGLSDCGDSELLVLCDTSDDGTVTPFARRIVTDCAGQTMMVNDLTLDGAPYTPTGRVGLCDTPEEEDESPSEDCAATVQILQLCDLDLNAEPDERGSICPTTFLRHLRYDCDGNVVGHEDTELDGITPYTPVGTVSDCNTAGSALVAVHWEQIHAEDDPNGVLGHDFLYTIAPEDGSQPQVVLQVHSSIDNRLQPCPGALSYQRDTTFTVTVPAPVMGMDSFRVYFDDFDSWEHYEISPVPDRVGGNAYLDGTTLRSNADNQVGWIEWDSPPASFTMTFRAPNNPGSCTFLRFGGVTRVEGCCGACNGKPITVSGGGGGGSTTSAQIIERCACDDTNGDGIGDVEYVEFWQIEPHQTPKLVGSFHADDLTEPYDPVSRVPCPALDSGGDGESPGGQGLFAAQASPLAPMVVRTGGLSSADSTPGQVDLAVGIGRLLSVTVTVHGGPPVLVHTDTGPVSVPAGTSASWAIPDTSGQLGTVVLETGTGSAYTTTYTYTH